MLFLFVLASMRVLVCNTISTGSCSSLQGNDSRQMIIKSEKNRKWDAVRAAKLSLIKSMSSLLSYSAGATSLAHTKSSEPNTAMP